MPITEFAHNFGSMTAGVAVAYSTQQRGTFRGNASVPTTATIRYAIIRNNTAGAVTVRGPLGDSIIGIGERKRVEMGGGARLFLVIPVATVTDTQLTADVGVEGCLF